MSSGSAVGAAGRSNVARFFDGDASGEAVAAGGAFFLKDDASGSSAATRDGGVIFSGAGTEMYLAAAGSGCTEAYEAPQPILGNNEREAVVNRANFATTLHGAFHGARARPRERPGGATAMFLAAAAAAQDFDTPAFLYDQQRFHEQLEGSRWSANQMDYVDGASSAVLRNPYTLAFDPYDESLFVASFTLNHIVRLRLHEKRKAQYKVFVSGQDVDSPVGMVLDDGVLYACSPTTSARAAQTVPANWQRRVTAPRVSRSARTVDLRRELLLKHIALAAERPPLARCRRATARTRSAWCAGWRRLSPSRRRCSAPRTWLDHNGDLHDGVLVELHKYNGTTGSRRRKGIVHGPVGITVGRDGDVCVRTRTTRSAAHKTAASPAPPSASASSGRRSAPSASPSPTTAPCRVVHRVVVANRGARTYVRVTD